MNNKSIILLSGGLDSVVSLAIAKEEYNIKLAITFNYGQNSFEQEFNYSKKIANFYNIKHQTINISWMKKFCKSAITSDTELPSININQLDDKIISQNSAKSVWIPNRNAIFINLASIYESMDYTHIIIGANKEEAKTFKDNSPEFIKAINNSLNTSTNNNIQVIAPLINMDKKEIVEKGIEYNIPFELIYSCYRAGKKHCGKCESCLRLKRALELNNRYDIIKEIFE